MLKFGNKEFNNLQEQVLVNANDIIEIKQSLGTALPNPIEGPQGETGPQGPQGQQGIRGTQWTVGTDLPASANEGDIHLNFDGHVYQYQNYSWVLQTSIKGPQGTIGQRGATGPQGQQGETGPQGPQGTASPIYVVRGILDDITQLPAPTTVEPNTAYIVGTDGEVKNLFVLISPDDDFAYWSNQGAFNTSALNASSISFENAGTTLSSTNVQTAIAELASDNVALQLQLAGLRTTVNNKDNELQGEINDIKASLNSTIFAVEPQEYKNVGVAIMDRANNYPIVDNQKSKLESIKGVSEVINGEIVSTDITKITVYGYNLFDGQIEGGRYSDTGTKVAGTNTFRSVNKIAIAGGQTYHILNNTSGTYYVNELDENGTVLNRITVPTSNYNFTAGTNTKEITIDCYSVGSGWGTNPPSNAQICIHNASVDLGFKPHTPNIEVNLATGTLNGIGIAQDEITETELKKVIGSVDLGTLTWYAGSDNRFSTYVSGIPNFKTPSANNIKVNVLTTKYTVYTADDFSVNKPDKSISCPSGAGVLLTIKDTDYNDVETFKQSLSGVMLYYELATPVITAEGFGELLFKVQRGGAIETDSKGDLTLNQVVYKPVE